ncbi:hypothetical protein TNCV_3788551 [Trichonephila clavipes]|nr:hypothetical protein TNCV_3788551 [Trichonephila clavipes]
MVIGFMLGGLRVTVVVSMCWSGVECGWKCGIVLLTKIRVPPEAGPSVIRVVSVAIVITDIEPLRWSPDGSLVVE